MRSIETCNNRLRRFPLNQMDQKGEKPHSIHLESARVFKKSIARSSQEAKGKRSLRPWELLASQTKNDSK